MPPLAFTAVGPGLFDSVVGGENIIVYAEPGKSARIRLVVNGLVGRPVLVFESSFVTREVTGDELAQATGQPVEPGLEGFEYEFAGNGGENYEIRLDQYSWTEPQNIVWDALYVRVFVASGKVAGSPLSGEDFLKRGGTWIRSILPDPDFPPDFAYRKSHLVIKNQTRDTIIEDVRDITPGMPFEVTISEPDPVPGRPSPQIAPGASLVVQHTLYDTEGRELYLHQMSEIRMLRRRLVIRFFNIVVHNDRDWDGAGDFTLKMDLFGRRYFPSGKGRDLQLVKSIKSTAEFEIADDDPNVLKGGAHSLPVAPDAQAYELIDLAETVGEDRLFPTLVVTLIEDDSPFGRDFGICQVDLEPIWGEGEYHSGKKTPLHLKLEDGTVATATVFGHWFVEYVE
jgi:hypothetical protein